MRKRVGFHARKWQEGRPTRLAKTPQAGPGRVDHWRGERRYGWRRTRQKQCSSGSQRMYLKTQCCQKRSMWSQLSI